MTSQTGSIILKSISSPDSEEQIISYLAEKAKSIPADRIPSLIKNLPLVLSRNVPEATAVTVITQLEQFGAEASYLPSRSPVQPVVDTNEIEIEVVEIEEMPQVEQSSMEKKSEPAIESIDTALAKEEATTIPIIKDQLMEGPDFSQAYYGGVSWKTKLKNALATANKELWIILSMVAIAYMLNHTLASQYLLLGFYTLPTILAAYYFGRRQAVMTSFACVLLVCILYYLNPETFLQNGSGPGGDNPWLHIMAWGGILVVTAYAMGTLHNKNATKVKELRQTYQGLLLILRHFISQDEYTENHCYRVSIYAAKIAAYMGLDKDYIEDVRAAALLHDIGKLKVSREILYKAAALTTNERKSIDLHVDNGAGLLEPMQGPLGRILPMVLGHHDKFDGSGNRPHQGEEIPLGARILAVADVYDALVSDRPYRKAMSPFEVKGIIVNGIGSEFDPGVVKAFVTAFDRREMEIPSVVI